MEESCTFFLYFIESTCTSLSLSLSLSDAEYYKIYVCTLFYSDLSVEKSLFYIYVI